MKIVADFNKEKKCWWILNHEWSKWEDGQMEMGNAYGMRMERLIQVRRCVKCGRLKVRFV